MKYRSIFLFLALLFILVSCSKKPTEPENNAPNTPGSPNPSNGATSQSINVDLSWTGGDPDGDPVAYNVYFGSSSPPPLVSNNQTAASYDPSTLNYNTKYFWKIVAEDNNGVQTEGSIWNFTTEPAYWEEYKNASGTYYNITGFYYDPDPVNGSPWIALSSYGTGGAEAYWAFYGLAKAEVETLEIGAYSYDDGWDATGGEEYWLYNHAISSWEFIFTSDKTLGWHGMYTAGIYAKNYIRDSDGAVFLAVVSGYTDHSHIKQVYCIETGAEIYSVMTKTTGTNQMDKRRESIKLYYPSGRTD